MKKKLIFIYFLLSCTICMSQQPDNLQLTATNDVGKSINTTKIGIYKCGRQPKQVLFSPDNQYIVLPLLDENGFDIFSLAEKKVIKRIKAPSGEKKGFAEGLFIPEKKRFLVSQMTTGSVYEYSYPDFSFIRTIKTQGDWSKFIAYNEKKSILAVSNWVSNDISIIDYESGNLLYKLNTAAAPRGIIFTNQGEKLISLSFDAGKIEEFSLDSKKKLNTISITNAAMRHIVIDSTENYGYISDMYHKSIYKIDLEKFIITETTKVFNNPNTIKLLDDKYLFVSCRGPNNPEDYTKRSPLNGKICIIDTTTMKNIKEIPGGNQPTGLDISNDKTLLCFSNFQDANIEIYQIAKE